MTTKTGQKRPTVSAVTKGGWIVPCSPQALTAETTPCVNEQAMWFCISHYTQESARVLSWWGRSLRGRVHRWQCEKKARCIPEFMTASNMRMLHLRKANVLNIHRAQLGEFSVLGSTPLLLFILQESFTFAILARSTLGKRAMMLVGYAENLL